MFAFSDTSDTMQINTLTFHMLKFSSLYSLSLMLTYIWDFFIIIILPIIINLLHFLSVIMHPVKCILNRSKVTLMDAIPFLKSACRFIKKL